MRTRIIIVKAPESAAIDHETARRIGLELRTKYCLDFDYGLTLRSQAAVEVAIDLNEGHGRDFMIITEPMFDTNSDLKMTDVAQWLRNLEQGHRGKDIIMIVGGEHIERGVAKLFGDKETKVLPPLGVCQLTFNNGQPEDYTWLDF